MLNITLYYTRFIYSGSFDAIKEIEQAGFNVNGLESIVMVDVAHLFSRYHYGVAIKEVSNVQCAVPKQDVNENYNK